MFRERSVFEFSFFSGIVGGVDFVVGGFGNVEWSRVFEVDIVLDVEVVNGGDRVVGGGELGDNGYFFGGVEFEVGFGIVEVGVVDMVGVNVVIWDGS